MGEVVTRVAGSHRSVHVHGRRLIGTSVESVTARGKHLVIAFDNGWAARSHLGMTGSWHLYPLGARWRLSPGKARLVLQTATKVGVCFAAPTVQIGPSAEITRALERLGPDLIHDEVPWSDVIERARRSAASTVADLLLDQEVMAGIGNVYKNEILFLQRMDPDTPLSLCSDETIVALGVRAQRLLTANADRPRRSTTGRSGRDAASWVYGRAGRPCRRCGTTITVTGTDAGERLTYWCPSCQAPESSSSAGAISDLDRSESNG